MISNSPIRIAEERETYLREDGSTFTREDIYVKLAVTFRDGMLKRLKGPKLSVFLCIALHCNRDMAAWPSTRQIQEETGYSNRAVITAIEQLCGMGLLTKRQHKHGGEYDHNRYQVQDFFSMGKGDVVNQSHEVVNVVHKGYEPSSQGVMNDVHTKKIPIEEHTIEEERECAAPAGAAPSGAADKPPDSGGQKKRTSKPKNPPKALSYTLMQFTVAKVCCLDTHTLSGKMLGRVIAAGNKLDEAHYTAEQIRALYGENSPWYKTWPGKDEQRPPRPEEVTDDIGRLLKVNGNGHKQPPEKRWMRVQDADGTTRDVEVTI